jgi:hypothetical protein
MAINTTRFPLRGAQPRSATTRRGPQPVRPSDDEILGLVTSVARPTQNPQPVGRASTSPVQVQRPTIKPAAQSAASQVQQQNVGEGVDSVPQAATDGQSVNGSPAEDTEANGTGQSSLTPEVEQILDAHPQLRAAWDTAQEFQSVFATPAAAQDAKSQLDELDSMFFSGDPSSQAALAARIHELSPEAFHALTQAMQAHAAQIGKQNPAPPSAQLQDANAVADNVSNSGSSTSSAQNLPSQTPVQSRREGTSDSASASRNTASVHSRSMNPAAQNSAELQNGAVRAAQLAFFHSTNSAAVHQVLAAIESQVTHLLPASISAPTKTRIVGEIYRDLGSALSANRQLGQQLRQAFRSGAGDGAHQRAIVALVAGRARQALPSIARRVINEWTHGVVSANHDKLSRQSDSAKRIDISGAASDGVKRRPVSPRDVDYKRLSDADILNL